MHIFLNTTMRFLPLKATLGIFQMRLWTLGQVGNDLSPDDLVTEDFWSMLDHVCTALLFDFFLLYSKGAYFPLLCCYACIVVCTPHIGK